MKDNTGLLKGIFRVFQYFLCLVITVITVYPFLFIVMTSVLFLPGQFQAGPYRRFFTVFPEQYHSVCVSGVFGGGLLHHGKLCHI